MAEMWRECLIRGLPVLEKEHEEDLGMLKAVLRGLDIDRSKVLKLIYDRKLTLKDLGDEKNIIQIRRTLNGRA